MRRKSAYAAALVFAAILALTGCTGEGEQGGSRDAQRMTDESGPPPGVPSRSGQLGAVVATRQGSVSGTNWSKPIRVELYELRRDQGFVTVNVRITDTTPEGGGGVFGWRAADFFSVEGSAGADGFDSVYLLDRKNRKKYLVARDAQKVCLCSTKLGLHVQPQQTIGLYATFGAPPDDVTVVDVYVPQVEAFENVPLG
ncbi:hypothetical protein [Plantactinospora sonchi]|uniref:Lipoprotein n=1 Tax=Plantactinospora sonchi TaxID=1544735 RepID=A0ABU7RYG2_9ACTN